MHSAKAWLFVGSMCWACGDSIGEDSCVGVETRCSLPRSSDWPEPAYPEQWVEVSTAELDTIAPAWERELVFDREGDPVEGGEVFGRLTGGGNAGLWYLRRSAQETSIEVFKLDDDGKVVDEGFISALLAPALEPSLNTNTFDHGLSFSDSAYNQGSGVAPVVHAFWSFACSDSARQTTCREDELIALEPDLSAMPLRVADSAFNRPQFARTADGGAWLYAGLGRRGVLHRYDASSQIIVRQTLVENTLPLELSAQGVSDVGNGSLLALSSEDDVYVYGYTTEFVGDELLWSFDASGNYKWHRRMGAQTHVTMAVDTHDRLVMFASSPAGDLLIQRFNAEGKVEIGLQAVREGYEALNPEVVTQDAAGNFYVRVTTGSRSLPASALCKLTLDAELTCFTLPALDYIRSGLVGGRENVVYELMAEVKEWPRVKLRRYEFP